MLTITAPISLKCTDRMLTSSYESFCERIRGNYSQLQADVSGEDLLHVVTTPPEIYLMGDGGSFVSRTTVNSRREEKLEILNQFLNRITVESNMPLTYQDRVYITNVLHKLGIRNVQTFMDQVNHIREEAVNTEQLISLYWQHMDELQEMVEEYHEEYTEGQETVKKDLRSYPLYLHEEIMNRLQTGFIYQILQNFNASQSSLTTELSSSELRLSEHYRTAQNILLNKLENTVRNEESPLVFYHGNYYEELPFFQEVTENNAQSSVTSAVLLQLIDNVFEQKVARQLLNRDIWLHLENVLYQTAENTLLRITEGDRIYSGQTLQGDILVSDLNQDIRQEIEMIHSLFDERNAYFTEEKANFLEREFTDRSSHYTADNRQISDRRVFRGDENISENSLLHLELDHGEMGRAVSEEEIEQLTQQFNRIDRSVSENRNQYIRLQQEQLRRSQERRRNAAESRPDREKQRRSRPEETPAERMPSAPGEEGFYGEDITYLQQEFQDQTYLLEENPEQIARQLEEINRVNLENRNKYIQILQSIQAEQAGKPPRANIAERMKRDSLAALTDPQELLHRYEEEAQESAVIEEARRERIMDLLPEQSKQIFQTLERYLESRGRAEAGGMPGRNDVGMLMEDAEAIRLEGERRRQALVHAETPDTAEQAAAAVTERIREQIETEKASPLVRRTAETVVNQLSLVHKRDTENQIDEEMLGEILQRSRSETRRTESVENVVQTAEQTRQSIQTQVSQQTVMETADIAEMIQKGVRRQMGEISEQVYSRLEKKLQNERKRRGI